MKRTHAVAYGVAVMVAAGAAAMSMSGTFELPWTETSNAGGSVGTLAGGPFELDITLGQQDYRIMSGGPYVVEGGFWPGAADVGPLIELTALIKLDSCPAPVNLDGHGVVYVAVTGEPGVVDVTELQMSSIRIARADGVGGEVAPYSGAVGPAAYFGDYDQPNDLDVGDGPGQVGCSCSGDSVPDGVMDVVIPFRTDDLAQALQLGSMPLGTEVTLTLTGALNDGTTFEASDCVALATTPGPPGLLTLSVRMDGALERDGWIDVTPLDDMLDGGGFGIFDRCFAEDTQVTLTAPTLLDGVRFAGWMVDGQFTASSPISMGGTGGDETLVVDVNSATREIIAVYGSLTGSSR